MSFLRRLRGKEQPAPGWAAFFTAKEYTSFMEVVRADLDRRGNPYAVGDGFIQMDGSSEELAEEFGLSNLAQLCHSSDPADWPVIVANHFSALRSSAGRDTDALAADFDQARPILRVRLMPDESMGGLNPSQIAVSRPYSPGIFLTLVYDFPDSTQSVPLEHLDLWPLDPDEVWGIAIDNTRHEPQPVRETVPGDGATFQLMMGDSFYVATRALVLEDELSPGTTDAVFAVPNRHMLLWHAIRDVSVVGAMQGMVQIASKAFVDGPGSISDQLYWWRPDRITHLPVQVKDRAIEFHPPDEFVEFLNSLAGPSA